MKSPAKRTQKNRPDANDPEGRRNWNAFVRNASREAQAVRKRALQGLRQGWRLELPRGRRLPFGYGLAWVDLSRWVAVCFPWPLNWLARGLRSGNWRLREICRAVAGPGIDAQLLAESQRAFRQEQDLAGQYAAGYLAGWEECFEACLEAVHAELGTPRNFRRPAPRRASRPTHCQQREEAANPACSPSEENENAEAEPIVNRLKIN